jgi:hypothetical protein
MKEELILQGFESLIQYLSIDLRYEKCDFAGGLCRINSKNVLIINNKLPVEKKINIIAEELKQLNLDQIYIRPVLRQLIEGRRAQ